MVNRINYSCTALIIALLVISPSFGQTTLTDSMLVDGKYRTFIVYSPSGVSHPPLVLVIHGLKMSASMMRSYTKFDKVADREKFITVYPQAIDLSWNMTGTADVNFLLALVDTIANRYDVDRNRIYSTGFSQGGFMSHTLGANHADKFAAIAPVSGTLVSRNIKPARPMPVLHIHGTADSMVSYSGVASTISTWVQKNGCPQTPVITNPYPSTKTDSKTVKEYYGPCDQNSEVILLTLNDVGHAWPTGGSQYDISAPEEIWAFFKNHSLNPVRITCGSPSTVSSGAVASARYANGALRIVFTGKIGSVGCLDISGKVVGSWPVEASEPRQGQGALSIRTKLPAGLHLLYFFEKTGEAGVKTVRLFVP